MTLIPPVQTISPRSYLPGPSSRPRAMSRPHQAQDVFFRGTAAQPATVDAPPSDEVTLRNGSRYSMKAVIRVAAQLESTLEQLHRYYGFNHVVHFAHHTLETANGEDAYCPPTRALAAQMGLLEEDGRMTPLVKDVVKSMLVLEWDEETHQAGIQILDPMQISLEDRTNLAFKISGGYRDAIKVAKHLMERGDEGFGIMNQLDLYGLVGNALDAGYRQYEGVDDLLEGFNRLDPDLMALRVLLDSEKNNHRGKITIKIKSEGDP